MGKARRDRQPEAHDAPIEEPAPLKGKKRDHNSKKGKPGGKSHRRHSHHHHYGLDDLERDLAVVGLRVKAVSADGNCFFRALSDQLHGNEGSHGELRARVMAHVEAEREQYEPFVEDDEPFAQYLARMRKDGTWAGNIELQAASAALGVNICVYQAGQPVWTIKNFPEHAPTLHLSYHDGEHYNSVRLAGDLGSGPPQPIALTASAADLAASGARRRGAWGDEEVARVAAGTGCGDQGRVEQALEDCGGDVDQAIELLIELLAREGDEEEAAGARVAEGQQTPLPAPAHPSTPTPAQPSSAGAASGAPAPAPEQQQRYRAELGAAAAPSSAGSGAAAGAAAESGPQDRAARDEGQEEHGHAFSQDDANTASSSNAALRHDLLELRLLPAPDDPDSRIVAEMRLASGQPAGHGALAACREGQAPRAAAAAPAAAAAAAPGLPGAGSAAQATGRVAVVGPGGATSEIAGSVQVSSGHNHQQQPEQQQQPEKEGLKPEGKKVKKSAKGVKLKSTSGSGAKDGKAPSRNKPCPCGSKQKFKNCCGAKRGGGVKQAPGKANGVAAAAQAAAVQLQTLYI